MGKAGQGRATRERAGISLRQMATLLEVDPGTLSRWERGETRPRLFAAIKWAEACRELEQEIHQEMKQPPALAEGTSEPSPTKDLVITSLSGDGPEPEPDGNACAP